MFEKACEGGTFASVRVPDYEENAVFRPTSLLAALRVFDEIGYHVLKLFVFGLKVVLQLHMEFAVLNRHVAEFCHHL
ncbi:hypothetical protein D3C80_1777690 [compost metagenome]